MNTIFAKGGAVEVRPQQAEGTIVGER